MVHSAHTAHWKISQQEPSCARSQMPAKEAAAFGRTEELLNEGVLVLETKMKSRNANHT